MNIFNTLYCRSYQAIMRLGMKFVKIPTPTVIQGSGSTTRIADILFSHEKTKVLIVTGNRVFGNGLLDNMLHALENKKIDYVIYKDVVPNPTIDNIEDAVKIYKENYCQAIVAFGGGSPMDCAKGVAARIARPDKTIPEMKGNLKVRKKVPLLIAVPTTAGTGSEATLAAVVSNPKTHEKYAINDPTLVPKYAVLDGTLLIGLSKNITSTTGMDALTHAVEAYIGKSNTKRTKKCAVLAVKHIFKELGKSCENPTDHVARSNMLLASYYAGVAFTRAYVGYVHSIAHTFGGFYNVPHGYANAIILPYVLEAYGSSAYRKLAELSDVVNLTRKEESDEVKAKAFISAIKDMNFKFGIPTNFNGIIKDEDLPLMVDRAYHEANPLYPVPKTFSKKELKEIYNKVRG